MTRQIDQITPDYTQLDSFSQTVKQKVDSALSELLPHSIKDKQTEPPNLVEAMRYSVLGSGKRIRPLLCFASAQVVLQSKGVADINTLFQNSAVLNAACSIELIHAYSLVHDDLPAMDDDELRRGQPTTHIKFDEATAILAGDALQTLAFSTLSNTNTINEKNVLNAIKLLAEASGMAGMVGGQMIDINSEGKQINLDQLAHMHSLKTGALIKSSVLLGAIMAGCNDKPQLKALEQYAKHIGLAFQIQDDILDCTATTEVLGKQQGADAERGKSTYVSLMGIEGAKSKLSETHAQALASLSNFEDNNLLSQLADYIVARNK